MRFLAWLSGAAGVVVLLLAVYGRFHNAPTITWMGQPFAGATFLLAGNTLLVLGAFLGVMDHRH
jgi:hypothetical protein